jgi:hypothetical protein
MATKGSSLCGALGVVVLAVAAMLAVVLVAAGKLL